MSRFTDEELNQKLESEEDFVALPRFGYSLQRVVERFPDGAPKDLIAKALNITVEEVQSRYDNAVKNLQRIILGEPR